MINATWRDRTPEFKSCLNAAQSKKINQQKAFENGKIDPVHKRSLFLDGANKISQGMYATYVKLEKLGTLCKSKSLFDDRGCEINDLMYMIKLEVTHLKSEIDTLSKIFETETSSGSKHGKNHRRSILTSLEKRLAHMSKDFKTMLEVRSENIRIQKDRRDNFSKNVVVPTLMNSQSVEAMGNLKNRSISLHTLSPSSNFPVETSPSSLYKPDTFAEGAHQVSSDHLNEQQDQLVIVQDNGPSYIQERLNAVQTIETTIVELGGIFQQLAHLVNEQEEHIVRIDQNIDHANMHIEAAHTELLKYFKNITSNRWLMVKIFGVLFIFIIIFLLIS